MIVNLLRHNVSLLDLLLFHGPRKSKWQLPVSSTESEYRALAHAYTEISWIQQLLRKLGFCSFRMPVLWCDNIDAGAIAINPVFHARTKHIEIDVHYQNNLLTVSPNLFPTQFCYLLFKLDLVYLPSCLKGDVKEKVQPPLCEVAANVD